MSDEESVTVDTSEAQLLTAEYRDGKKFDKRELQNSINDAKKFDQNDSKSIIVEETHILPDQIENDGKYTMVETDKGLMQLDLLNLTLVRCEDGEESYRIVSGEGSEDDGDGTVTCVLQSSDSDNHENQDSYVMMENEQGNLVLLQPSQSQMQAHNEPKPSTVKVLKGPATPAEILEKAKAMQKAKSILAHIQSPRVGKRGRKRKSDLPPPHELLASPNFKLYLYSCKMCTFKCNAVKELTAHKASAHGPGKMRALRGVASLQCARCPYKASTPSMLEKHLESHEADSSSNFEVSSERLTLDQLEVAEADVLVCGACGFECPSREDFKRHIEKVHQGGGEGS